MLEFDFRSSSEADRHQIGLDSTKSNSRKFRHSFQTYGTEAPRGLSEFDNYSGSGEWQHYVIPIGRHFTGEMRYMTFINDHDVPNATGEGVWSNIRVYEATP